MNPMRCGNHVYSSVHPSSRAKSSAILFSKPSPARLENGRLFGSSQTRSTRSPPTVSLCCADAPNDGKLRIPIQGVTSMTPELQRVLKHELTHSFVRFMVGDRCPSWLNEGLAQLMEARSSSPYAGVLAGLFEQHKQIPFAALERPFNGLSEIQASVAYAESLSALEYLRSRYGMDDVLRILRRVGSGEAPEGALRAVTRSDYAD